MTDSNYHAVARLAEIPLGKTLRVQLADQYILLCHTKEGLYAISNLCSHAAEPLDGGRLKGCKIHCPLHGAAFDVRDGSALSRPATLPLNTFPVRIEGEQVYVAREDAE